MFEFIPETHEYFLNGKRLMSVSELLNPLFSMPEDDYLELFIEKAAERGTVCHKIIEMILRGEGIEGEYPEEYDMYIEAIQQFISEHEIIPIHIETPLYNKQLDIAGTPDLIALFDGATAILDYKFVSQIHKSKVGTQLVSYCELCEENGIEIENCYAVHFKSDGNYTLYPVNISMDSIGYQYFNAALEIKRLGELKHPRGRIG
jgi:hypothetical protein